MAGKEYLRLGCILLLTALVGCRTMVNAVGTAADSLTTHPKAAVRVPARTGYRVFAIVPGVPLAILLAPVTIPIGYLSRSNIWPLYAIIPACVSATTGAILVGGIPYSIVGWWGTAPATPHGADCAAVVAAPGEEETNQDQGASPSPPCGVKERQ